MSTFGFQQQQVFTTTELEEIERNDVISAAAYSDDGNHIAIGDKGGRIWVYSTPEGKQRCKPRTHDRVESLDYKENSSPDSDDYRTSGFEFYGQFQSHETEFDYLKSLEIEEKINVIQWCPRSSNALTLLAANDKSIKLWKIFEKPMLKPSFSLFDPNTREPVGDYDKLPIPKLDAQEILTAAIPRRTYANAHTYHINSVTLCSDKESFISADDLRINLWNLEISDKSFCICDLKPENMEDLSMVIKHVEFHPQHCNYVSYCTSRGELALCDLRANSTIKSHLKLFKQRDKKRDFFSDITEQLLHSTFDLLDSNKVFTRDYRNVRVWDLRSEKEPYLTVEIPGLGQECLESLYQNEGIFDSFSVSSSRNRKVFATGAYNGTFLLCNWETGEKEIQRISSSRADQENFAPPSSTKSSDPMDVDFVTVNAPVDKPWVKNGVYNLTFSKFDSLLCTQASEFALWSSPLLPS